MVISEIYKKYKIMPNLQEHMLRVAGVSLIISENYKTAVNKDKLATAALLHDLGNMAKIKLEAFPEFAEPLGIDYWKGVLQEFKKNYGDNDYTATYKILNEIHIPQNIFDLIHSLEFAKSPETVRGNNQELKICLYSDARVSPHGVVSLKERINEVKTRYMKNKKIDEDSFNRIAESLYTIEEHIFTHCTIRPEEITEEKVKPLIVKLINFNIVTE